MTDNAHLKLGVGLLIGGFVLAGYALTVEVLWFVPRFTFDTRHLRWTAFVVGMVALSLGLARTAQELESHRSEITEGVESVEQTERAKKS